MYANYRLSDESILHCHEAQQTLACTINYSPGSQTAIEATHQDHSVWIYLLVLVHVTYSCTALTEQPQQYKTYL